MQSTNVVHQFITVLWHCSVLQTCCHGDVWRHQHGCRCRFFSWSPPGHQRSPGVDALLAKLLTHNTVDDDVHAGVEDEQEVARDHQHEVPNGHWALAVLLALWILVYVGDLVEIEHYARGVAHLGEWWSFKAEFMLRSMNTARKLGNFWNVVSFVFQAR